MGAKNGPVGRNGLSYIEDLFNVYQTMFLSYSDCENPKNIYSPGIVWASRAVCVVYIELQGFGNAD